MRTMRAAAPRSAATSLFDRNEAASSPIGDLPSGHCLLHRKLRLEAVDVAVDRGDGEHASLGLVAQHAVAPLDVAVDGDLVPFLGVADIIDRHVVMLAPEERHGV